VLVNSGEWSGKLSQDRDREMARTRAKRFRRPAVTYRIRDWGISRQAFLGRADSRRLLSEVRMVPVPETDLPVMLPAKAEFTGTGESPLKTVPEFVNTNVRSAVEARRAN
jgi:leucyl-tRNA synthetase